MIKYPSQRAQRHEKEHFVRTERSTAPHHEILLRTTAGIDIEQDLAFVPRVRDACRRSGAEPVGDMAHRAPRRDRRKTSHSRSRAAGYRGRQRISHDLAE